jgi:transposase InsO family protein
LTGVWVPHDTRDQVVDSVNRWSSATGLAVACFLVWLGIATSKWHSWKNRYGKANEHNAWIPRDHWLEPEEKQAILDFHARYPLEGYRRLTFMMLDADVAACSPASVYRVLKAAGVLGRHTTKSSAKAKGFVQPLRPHEHWHVDVASLNIAGTFYHLCSIRDGYSRFIVHWEIRPTMTEADVEQVVQRARERFPGVTPRVISDNGPQFIAKDFKEFIRVCGMTHGTTSPYYPQSNGKIERFHRTIKGDCIRTQTPLSLEGAQRVVARYVEHDNTVRLHSALGYVTPQAKLEGRDKEILAERERRKQKRQAARQAALDGQPAVATTEPEA